MQAVLLHQLLDDRLSHVRIYLHSLVLAGYQYLIC